MRWRSLAVLGAGLAGAAAAWLLLPSPQKEAFALALACSGVLAALVLGPSGVPPGAARELAAGSMRSSHDLAEALDLLHRPVFVPATGNLDRERLFLSADPARRPLPVLDPSTRLYAAPAGAAFGVAVEPPGLALVLEAEEATGQRLPSTETGEVEAFLGALGARTGLWSGLTVTGAEPHVVRFVPGPAAPCRAPGGAKRCASGLCPVCSAMAVALSRARQRPLALAEAEAEERTMRLILEAAT